MVILGIDPGIERTGFGVINVDAAGAKPLDFGRIRTAKTLPFATRLRELTGDLTSIILKWRPDYAAVEELFFSKNTKTAMTVAHARGVVLELLEEHGIPVIELNPGTVKQSITGNGRADKTQVMRMIKRLLNISQPLAYDDVADALAVAMCASTMTKTYAAH